jgi:hypothetical protein
MNCARRTRNVALPLLAGILLASAGFAEEVENNLTPEVERNLAQELSNPIASLYTLPMQLNFDQDLGANGEGSQTLLNLQPLIPFSLNEDWHLISRSIVPLIDQQDVAWKGQDETGVGDVIQSLFLSPSETPDHGWIWGVGPAASLPTASHDAFGIDSWAFGPTAVVLKTKETWTVGALVSHLWSIDEGSDDYNGTYFEPWISYVTPTNTTISLSFESIYDWNNDDLALPLNFIVDQLVTIADRPVSIGAAVKYWADSAEGGPEDWGLRLQVTLIWPN